MRKAYFAGYAPAELSLKIQALGAEPCPLQPFGGADAVTGAHADMQMCRLGALASAKVIRAVRPLSAEYPACAAYNALVFGKYFVHRLDCTAPELLKAAEAGGFRLVDVRQGYAKCSAAIVSDTALITADRGIARAAENFADVLLISPEGVSLPGYACGFIGGACGTVGGKLLFCGALQDHPDADRIRAFAEKHGRSIADIPGLPLLDVGSIIETEE